MPILYCVNFEKINLPQILSVSMTLIWQCYLDLNVMGFKTQNFWLEYLCNNKKKILPKYFKNLRYRKRKTLFKMWSSMGLLAFPFCHSKLDRNSNANVTLSGQDFNKGLQRHLCYLSSPLWVSLMMNVIDVSQSTTEILEIVNQKVDKSLVVVVKPFFVLQIPQMDKG